MSGEIGLRELIQQVKKELYTPVKEDPYPFFSLDSVDLELAVTYRVEGNAGIKIYVVDIGSAGSHEKTHTIHVHLSPLLSKDELRNLIEQNPALKQRIEETALDMQIKDIFG